MICILDIYIVVLQVILFLANESEDSFRMVLTLDVDIWLGY